MKIDDFDDERYPTKLCSNCYTIVSEYKHNIFTRKIILFDHSKLPKIRLFTRNTDKCECLVCDTARASTTLNFALSKSVMQKRKPGPIPSKSVDTPSPISMCSHCFSELARGKPHNCTQTQRHDNLLSYAAGTSSGVKHDSRESLATSIIRSKMEENMNDTNICSLSAKRGRPLSIEISPKVSATKVTAEDFHRIQSDLNLSTNQTKTLGKHIRSSFGTRSVTEPYIREKLQQKAHQLDNLFTSEFRDFDCTNNASSVPVIFCCDVEELKNRIVHHRNFQENFESIIGIDSGGSFLKVCLTARSSSLSQESGHDLARSRLSDGVAAKSLKDTSVKKLFILAVVPDAQESYRNLLILWNLLKFTSPQTLSPYTFCMDLKLANIMIGLMSHSCLHPCTWCNVEKDKLDCEGELRTLGNIRECYWSFTESERKTTKAKEYGNCIHAPPFKYGDDTLVLDLIPPPELHLMLGTVNLLYSNLEKVWPDVIQWPSSLYIEKEAIHGGSFAGNGCRKLLRNIDQLERCIPDEHLLFVDAFKAFNEVVVSCFGKSLHTNYKSRIERFRRTFQKLGIRVTPKVHSIIFHVIEFCDSKRCGLGTWSEQAFESVHSDFAKHWEKYKVPLSHNKFPDRLLRAVQEYNSNH